MHTGKKGGTENREEGKTERRRDWERKKKLKKKKGRKTGDWKGGKQWDFGRETEEKLQLNPDKKPERKRKEKRKRSGRVEPLVSSKGNRGDERTGGRKRDWKGESALGRERRREKQNRETEKTRKKKTKERRGPRTRGQRRSIQGNRSRALAGHPSRLRLPNQRASQANKKRRRAREQESFASSRPGKFFLFPAFHFNSPATVYFEF